MPTRVAIVAGVRTPFARVAGQLAGYSTIELGAMVVRELLARTGVAPGAIERVVFGQVVPTLVTPNVAREVALDAGLPPTVDAYSVSRACTTSYQATIDIARAIETGDITCGIAGGADSVSQVPVAASPKLAAAVVRQRRARTLVDRVRAFSGIAPADLVPRLPGLTERTTGMSMGEHAEAMAAARGITRRAQDDFAMRSHRRAAAAWASGALGRDVMPVPPLVSDPMVQRDPSPASFARREAAFVDGGTVTAANASPLSDGAAAILLVREDVARSWGLTPLAYLRAHATCAVDPRDELLIGPAHAIPRALARAGATLSDLALLDLHEAFAAQVLSVLDALASPTWCAAHLGTAPLGTVPDARLNVSGGSIALGHPFAATGARQLLHTARTLSTTGGGLACISACAAGGLGAAIVIES